MDKFTAVVGEYPHTQLLNNGSVKPDGIDCEFIFVRPLYSAFTHMVRELRYHLCEMPICTFLQAREAGEPISLLPIVMLGDNHHQSLVRWPDSDSIGPMDLVGKKIGIRAYPMTTSVWVRGFLQEEYGIKSGDVKWMAVEEPHADSYVEPPWVERIPSRVDSQFGVASKDDVRAALADLLQRGETVASVLDPSAIADQGIELIPIIPNHEQASLAWSERHQTIPINHMLTIRTEMLRSYPEATRSIYQAVSQAIDQTSEARGQGNPANAKIVGAGLSDKLLKSVEIAIRYAREQEVLREDVSIDELFADSDVYL